MRAALFYGPAGPNQSAVITFLAGGVNAVPRSLQSKNRDIVSVKDIGAVGDGVTNDLMAFQKLAAQLTDNCEVNFPPARYFMSYSGAKPEKSTIAFDIAGLSNIKINGHGSTLVITNHDVGLFGGLLFARLRACKNVEILGFKIEFSFVGTNTSALCYPESGFLYISNTEENATVPPVSYANRSENISVHHNYFDIRSQYGAYSTSPNPYQGDANNGGKYYSIFIRGEQSEATYENQNKAVEAYFNVFAETHQAYGIWIYGFSNNNVHRNKFLAWAPRTADYLNNTIGGSVPAIRCHKFHTTDWRIEKNIIHARASGLRTSGLNGGGALIGFQQDASAYHSESTVAICDNTLIIGSNPDGSILDTAIEFKCSGNFDVFNNTIGSIAAIAGASGITLNDSISCAGLTQYYNIKGNTFNPSCDKIKSLSYSSASNVSSADRSIRSLIFTDNIIQAYYQSVCVRVGNGKTYEGIPFQIVEGNKINGAANTSVPKTDVNNIPLDIYIEQASDIAIVDNNTVVSSNSAIRLTGPSAANCVPRGNRIVDAVANNVSGGGGINYTPKSTVAVTSFASAQNVVVQGTARELYAVSGIATDATGLVKDKLAGNYPGGTLIVASPTGFTWLLFQTEIGQK